MKTNEKPQRFYTTIPSVLVFKLAEHPMAMILLQYVIIRRKVFPKFRVNEIARSLNKDVKTVRAALKILVELELMTLTGTTGSQFYQFNATRFVEYFAVNPFVGLPPPSQKVVGDASHKAVGGPAEKREATPPTRREGIEEKREIERMREEKTKTPSAGVERTSPKMDELENACRDFFPEFFSGSLQPPKASGSFQASEGTGQSVSASYARGIIVPSDDELEAWGREVMLPSLASTSPAPGSSGLTEERVTTPTAPLTLANGEWSPTGSPVPKLDRTVNDAVDRIRMRMHPGESARFSTLIRLHKGPLTLPDVLRYQNAV